MTDATSSKKPYDYEAPKLTTYGRVDELTRTGCYDLNGDGLGKSFNGSSDSQWGPLGYVGLGDCSA